MKKHFIRVAQALGIGVFVLGLSESSVLALLIGSLFVATSVAIDLVWNSSRFKIVLAIIENSFLATAPNILFLHGEKLVQLIAASYLLGAIWLALILFEYYARKEK